MTDRIVLSGMRFFGYHGVYPEETKNGQTFVVDVELSTDLRTAGAHDDLKETINYVKVYRTVQQVVEGQPYKLIEAVADRLANRLLDAFPISEIVVRVHKPGAPMPGPVAGIMVEIRRQKGP